MKDSEAIEKTVKTIISKLEEMNEKVFTDLSEKGPETTKRIRFFLGNKNHLRDGVQFGEHLSYRDFLGAVLTSYLRSRGVEADSPFNPRYLKDIDWNSSGEISGGVYFSGDLIFTEVIPFSEVKNIEETLEGNLDNSEIRKPLRNFLRSYLELMDEEYQKSNYRTLKNVVSHELTHYFVRHNTEIGDLRDYSESDELLDQVDMERMVMDANGESSGLVNVKMQAERVSKNTTLTTIEEIFCFFVGNCYTKKNLSRNPEDFSHSYENPEEIAWGIKIIEEKTSELDGPAVDWARRKAVQTMEKIAQMGQVRKSGGERRPESVFLKTMLPSDEKYRLKKFREICEGELRTAFLDLKRTVEETEGSNEITSREYNELEKLREDIDWENPAHIEDVVLHRTATKAVEEMHSLEEAVNLFNRNIEKEVKKLRQYLEETRKTGKDLHSRNEKQRMEEAMSEIEKSTKDIKKILSN